MPAIGNVTSGPAGSSAERALTRPGARRRGRRKVQRLKRQELARRRVLREAQRARLQELSNDVIPRLATRATRLRTQAPTPFSPSLLSLDPLASQKETRKVSRAERQLAQAEAERRVLASKITKRRGARATPVTPLEVGLAVAGALPPVRAAQGAGLLAKAFGIGGKTTTTTKATGAAVSRSAPKAASGASKAAKPVKAAPRASKRLPAKPKARGRVRSRMQKRVDKRLARELVKPSSRLKKSHLAADPVLAVAASGDKKVQRALTTPYYLGKATVRDPIGVAKASGASLRDALLGLPAAAYATATDPVGTAKTVVADYKARYGPLLEGNEEEFMARVKQTGLTPFAFDALVVAPPAGRVAGAAARSGSLGKKAQRLATEDRPLLRTSPNEARPQKLSKNLITVAAQKKVIDKARARRQKTREARGSAQGIRTREGEVTPLALKRRLRKDAARRKGLARVAMQREQLDEVHRGVSKKARTELNAAERRGIKYAIQLGIPEKPDVARQALMERRAQITAERSRRSKEDPDYRAPAKTLDELTEINWLIKNADEVFTPALAAYMREQRGRGTRLARQDPGINTTQALLRARAQQLEHLGLTRNKGETDAQFLSRGRRAAEAKGLEIPGYFPSQLKQTSYAAFAVGGRKAVAGPKRYKGALFREGIEDPRPEALAQGFARNIKRKYNWNLVADTFDSASIPWSRDAKNLGELVHRAQRELGEGWESEVGFWNPRLFREQRVVAEMSDTDEITGGIEDRQQGVPEAVTTIDTQGRTLATNPENFKETGWQLIPQAIFDEVHSSAKASGVGRGMDIVTQKQSRFILGSLNVPWLQFQVASNAVLTGLAGASPLDWIAAQRWWGTLSAEQRRDLEPYVGIGHFTSDTQQTKLGAASNSRIVNAYRAFKETVGGKYIYGTGGRAQVRNLNPLDAMFRADNAQNNFFRKAVLYNRLKRDAYQRMGESLSGIGRTQNRIASALGKGPREQMNLLLKDKRTLEEHAQHVNDFLGDYTTYTARERAFLKKNVMFYGFLRYSLRFAFYTMPIKHPIMVGLMGNLARLKVEETRDLLGGNELPFALGRVYKDGGNLTLDLARANPVTNALVTSLGAPSTDEKFFSMTGLLPPLYGAIISQVSQRDPFTGKPWIVQGETQPRNLLDVPFSDRGEILAKQGLSIFFPYRVADQLSRRGRPVGSDHLIFKPAYTNYKDPTVKKSIAKTVREQEGLSVSEFISPEIFPFQFAPSRDIGIAKSLRDRRIEEAKAQGMTREEAAALGVIYPKKKPDADSIADQMFGASSSRASAISAQMFD